MIDIPSTLRARRIALGLTQQQVADRASPSTLSQTSISGCETGARPLVRVAALQAWCDVLGLTLGPKLTDNVLLTYDPIRR
jgi:transcriptional regulator with XRE-family HTH domain